MQNTTFEDLKLAAPILRAVKSQNYKEPTAIQAQAIPHLLNGSDLIGSARTGTGKTAAFALPILHRIVVEPKKLSPRHARALILTPTRELATQISESFKVYGKNVRFRQALVLGGMKQYPQVKAISNGAEIIVATPGRLLDLIRQGYIKLSQVEVFVLDEADRMLDMGFLPDIKKIIEELPEKHQALLFSATMPPPIRQLAEKMLTNPVNIIADEPATVALNIDEQIFFVDDGNKSLLLSDILKKSDVERMLVFTRTKHGADRLTKKLNSTNVSACAIHGDKSQSARNTALENFRRGRCNILVATDVASRGIDVKGITHVINYDLPNEPESYVHRIGRTARAGKAGTAISFCGVEERIYLRDIERLLKRSVPVCKDHAYHSERAERAAPSAKKVVSARNRFNPNRAKRHLKPWERRAVKRTSKGGRTNFESR